MKPNRRLSVTLLLAAFVVVAQTLVIAHAQEHAWAPDNTICDSCLLGQSLGGACDAGPVALDLSGPHTEVLSLGDRPLPATRPARAHPCRAPPVRTIV